MNRGQATDAILDSDTSAVQVAILLGYIRHMPSGVQVEQGVSWPSAERLARYAGTTRSTAVRQRRALIDAGVLLDAGTPKGGTPHLRIDFEALAGFSAKRAKRRTPSREERWGSTDDATGSTDSATGVSDSRTGGVPSSDEGCPIVGHKPSPENPLKEPSAETASPAEPEPQLDQPLWESMGLPEPGKGVPQKHLTADVLDLYAYWLQRYSKFLESRSQRGTIRRMGKADLAAIAGALKRDPEDVNVDGDAWPIKRLIAVTLAYPLQAPDDSDRVEWMRKKPSEFLRPAFILRDGAAKPQWSLLAPLAVAWKALRPPVPALHLLDGGRVDAHACTPEALALALWNEYTSGFQGIRDRVARHGVSPALFAAWRDMSATAVPFHIVRGMRANDAPFRRKDYLQAAVPWVRVHLRGAA